MKKSFVAVVFAVALMLTPMLSACTPKSEELFSKDFSNLKVVVTFDDTEFMAVERSNNLFNISSPLLGEVLSAYGTTGDSALIEREEETSTIYIEIEEEWYKTEFDEEAAEMFTTIFDMFSAIKDSYLKKDGEYYYVGEEHYDAIQEAWGFSDEGEDAEDDETLDFMRVKIANGKLVLFEIQATEGEGDDAETMIMSFAFSKYGEIELAIPEEVTDIAELEPAA